MKRNILLMLIFYALIFSCDRSYESYDNYVLLVSFDGYRWDYPDLYKTPNFDALERDGVKAERVIPSFPTKTFPNHYSIATGLYPDNHGLINNTFYAPDLDLTYRIGDRSMVENGDFYSGEPIWNTANKQGMISASFFWVGSEAAIQGMQPEKWKPYDGSVAYKARVDTVMNWLKKPLKERPRLILLYFHQPDWVAHDFGPVHSETAKVIEELDDILGYLRKNLDRLPYGDKVNLIVTSDHGMGSTSPERYVNIKDYVKEDWLDKVLGGNPVYLIDAADGYEDSIVGRLDPLEGITAWKKDNIPARLKYGSNTRIPDIVVVADSSWSLGLKSDAEGYSGGAHGYDNSNTDMHNIFYATGPAFKNNYLHPPFENVDIYPLLAHILNLDPADTDGKLENVSEMLK